MTQDILLAENPDVPRVKAVTDAAYHHYIERIGLVPAPMEADHAADVAAGRVFVAGDPVVGGGGVRGGGGDPANGKKASHP
ncbi:hypothetical protein ACFQ7Q_20330, partial [Streptomyces sp. NPDC056527]